MFHANMNSIQLRMFSVIVLNSEKINKIITDAFIEKDKKGAGIFMKNNKIKGDFIPFFTKDKEYPVLGYNGKANVQAEQSSIDVRGAGLKMNYSEQEYLLIPDNYGFMRLIQRGDLMLAAYEHAEEINWDSKLVQSEDAEV